MPCSSLAISREWSRGMGAVRDDPAYGWGSQVHRSLTHHGEFTCRSEHLAAQRRTKKYVCKAKRFLTLRVKKERGGQWPEGSAWAEMKEMKLQWWAKSQWKPRGEERPIRSSLMLVLHLPFITSMTLVSNTRCSWPLYMFLMKNGTI